MQNDTKSKAVNTLKEKGKKVKMKKAELIKIIGPNAQHRVVDKVV